MFLYQNILYQCIKNKLRKAKFLTFGDEVESGAKVDMYVVVFAVTIVFVVVMVSNIVLGAVDDVLFVSDIVLARTCPPIKCGSAWW